MNKKRAIVIIIDGVGVGELPDAANYGDAGSNTLGNIAKFVGKLCLPNLEKLGLGKITAINGLSAEIGAKGVFGKLKEKSPGKDSTTGHWELAGLELSKPFPTYPDGFPNELLNRFTKDTGYGAIGNKPASGTEIIKELGEEHLNTGKLIVYTSADSVFQIAAHSKIISVERLYEICETARNLLTGEHAVARVIARPFEGNHPENFKRTKYRKDFSLKPFGTILHQNLLNAGIDTVGIGKINDLYANTGIKKQILTKTNQEGMEAVLKELNKTKAGFIMVNLVDFDMLWGHRNLPAEFYEGLKAFDVWLSRLFAAIDENDTVFITADHGNDPTMPSTDHSREYVPLLAFGDKVNPNIDIGVRESFADLQATVAEYFNVNSTGNGSSFLSYMIN
jgi:phosphopentomutase